MSPSPDPETPPTPITRAAAGDEKAIEALIEEHLPGLAAFVRLRAGDHLRAHDSTQDLVQSACREVLNDMTSAPLEDRSHFRHWLFLAAERKIVDRARYHHRGRRDRRREAGGMTALEGMVATCYGTALSPATKAMAREGLDRIEGAFDQLPDDYREVIVLSRFVGLSHRDIAKRLGKKEVTVRGLLHRALARLASLIGPEPL